MTCKDCISYEACKENKYLIDGEWYDSTTDSQKINYDTMLDYCSHFKNKSTMIELPCDAIFNSVGNTVYYIYQDEIVEAINCSVDFNNKDKQWYINIVCEENIFPYREPIAGIDDAFDWCINSNSINASEFDKTIFLTKEEAEHYSKENNNNES